MNGTILQFENISKLYVLGQVGTGTLASDLTRWWKTSVLRQEDPFLQIGETNDKRKKGMSDCVWALKDISFGVRQGEVVGIIGKNGAGKSTLLKLLSRITSPTRGEIRVKGRIASLLEVGTGFHGDLTGRDNIYMNGAIMGMTRSEITRKLDEIVAFAGVERYIDTPVKRYSSGMFVRLGFAVAAFLEPEILVVDEVLAVGDAEFQKKAIGKMQDVSRSEGRTVLFVSHNMAAVKNLCTRGIVLENGMMTFDGGISEAVNLYMKGHGESCGGRIADCIKSKKSWLNITKIELNGTENRASTIASGQEVLTLVIEGETGEPMQTDVMLILKNRDDVPMASLAEGHCKGRIERIGRGRFRIERNIRLPKFMSEGDYVVDLYLHHPNVEYQMKAPECAEIHSEGYHVEFGRALKLTEEGIYGLETIE